MTCLLPFQPPSLSRWAALFLLLSALELRAQSGSLPGTELLSETSDRSAAMVTGINAYLDRLAANDLQVHRSIEQSDAHRLRLRRMIGAVDERVRFGALEFVSNSATPHLAGETRAFTVEVVRWPVFAGVTAEGLWLRPKTAVLARVVALPDADQTPEVLVGLAPGLPPERQFARRLAENGCEVLVPTLINRQDTYSGNPAINRFTNQPHREWIYRQAFELGRHIIGYEVQKALAAVDWFTNATPARPIGLAGYGEGGLVALHAAALDTDITAALVSGYFNSRQKLWQEPIYRNVFGFLKEFGDAELAAMISPRGLVVEHSLGPKVNGPPPPRQGRSGAAPGVLVPPDYEDVENEVERARSLMASGGDKPESTELISGAEGMTTGPGSDRALSAFLRKLGAKIETVKLSEEVPREQRTNAASLIEQRQEQQVSELVEFTQRIYRHSEQLRDERFWTKLKTNTPEEWATAVRPFRSMLHEEVIGALPSSAQPLSPKSRPLDQYRSASWTAHEVVLGVDQDVFAWGYLLVPKGIPQGEKRPVVVCQHGLEGVPADIINTNQESSAYGYYQAFGARLAERGFVVFAPHNPYRGGDTFRVLQRKANPLGLSLFSFILAQHQRILDWLASLPFVDPERIGFYGLSYGGKTAMRVPAVLEGYAMSICSGDFNDWIRKNVSIEYTGSYMFSGEYEMPEFNLGSTFNYAEMAALIAPRPFMVERGHEDPVGKDEWVAFEYTKVKRLYDELGITDKSAIEYFNGPHRINAQGTFRFLHQQLHWPEPKSSVH